MSPEKKKAWEELFETVGLSEGVIEKGRQKGLQEVFALLEKGCSVAEAKKQLNLTPATSTM